VFTKYLKWWLSYLDVKIDTVSNSIRPKAHFWMHTNHTIMSGEIRRIESLPFYTTILSILVVMIHNHIPPYYPEPTYSIDKFLHYFLVSVVPKVTSIAVPSFFILSGYLFYRNYNISDTFVKYKSRIRSLLIPYIIWNTLGLVIEMISRIPFFASMGTVDSNPFAVRNILFGIFFHQYTILWFVFALIVFVILCPIIYVALKNKILGVLSIGIIIILISTEVLDVTLPNELYFETSSLPYYMIGGYLGIHYKPFYQKMWKHYYMVISTIVFIVLIILQIKFESLYKLSILVEVLKSLCFWVVCSHFVSGVKSKEWHKFSFFIFVFHLPVVRCISGFFRLLAAKLSLSFIGEEFILYILVTIVTLYICIWTAFLWNNYAPRTYSIVTGNR